MWNKILDLWKFVFDKYFIPAIITVPITIILYVIIPETNFIQAKVGNSIFVVFIYTSIFLLILFVIQVKKCITYKIDKRKQTVENERQLKEQQKRNEILKRNKEMEMFEELWNKVDALKNNDRMLIDVLLENGNKPIGMINMEYKHELKYFVYFTSMKYGDKCKVLIDGCFHDFTMKYKSSIYEGYYKCKLKDDIYLLLKQSKEKYDKISHFS